jgi:hypothetical protein
LGSTLTASWAERIGARQKQVVRLKSASAIRIFFLLMGWHVLWVSSFVGRHVDWFAHDDMLVVSLVVGPDRAEDALNATPPGGRCQFDRGKI